MATNYVPLHVHTYYSELDSSASPEAYMARAKELGIDYLSQTDHGTTSGHRHFQRAAKEAGITPILGVEAYYTEDMHDRRSAAKRQDGTQVYNHLTILAKDDEGLRNLNKINKIAWQEGFYHKPRIGKDLLFENSKGLIVLSGCISGMISKAILAGDMERAEKIAREHKEALGDDFYMEVMATNGLIPEAVTLNHKLLDLADKLKIKPVITSDCHYVGKDDLVLEEAILILSTNPKPNFNADISHSQTLDWLERFNYLYPDRRMTFQDIEVYLRSYQSEKELFEQQGIVREDIFEHTWDIANKIGEYPYHKGLDMLPQPKVDPKAKLRDLVYKGLKDRGVDTPEYHERAEEELKVIFDKGFETYFLVLYRLMQWARKEKVRTGYGRGSGAGSLVNYSLGLTQVDPIKYNLLFFRFLDPERNDFPDVDLDFEDTRREEAKDFFRQTFVSVAGISTITFFQGKSSIRDAARVLRVPLKDVNKALKDNDASLAMNESYEYYDWFIKTDRGREFNKKYPEVIELARLLYGKLKSFGQHASAIVASKEPIENYAPVQTAKRSDSDTERADIIALSMGEVEEAGFIKFDILGLKALSIVGDTLRYVKQRHDVDIDMLNLPLDDPAIYATISRGHTKGIFQAEQPAYTGLILNMGGVNNFDELVASNALVRPGAMKSIGPDYIARKSGKEPVVYVHEDIRYFTENTYGLPTLYQEQTMLLCVELGGMTMAEANQVRRGLGKKQIEKILPFKEKFIENASKKIGLMKAEKLWSDIEFGAEYSFNLSHSVCYSMLTYAMAWLKHYYPVEFMAATIRNEKDKDSITDYLIEARRLGIKIKLPHVNTSGLRAEPEGNDAIRLGLTNIKYCGEKVAKQVLLHRPFANYKELKEKVEEKGSGMNKRMLSTMNLVGAAYFPDNPRTGRERDNYYDVLKIPAFAKDALDPRVENKIVDIEDLTDEVSMIKVMLRNIVKKDNWARADVLDETGSVGLFTDPNSKAETGKMYLMLVSGNSIMRAVNLEKVDSSSQNSFIRYLYGKTPELSEGQYYTIAFKARKTKTNKDMANLIAVDHTGRMIDILVWPSDFESASKACGQGMVWKYEVKEKEDEDGKVSYFLSLDNGRRRFGRAARSSD